MDLFGEGSSWERMCTYGRCMSSLALPPVFEIQTGRMQQRRKNAPRLRCSFLCRGQVADCWSWEMKAWEDHWSAVQYTAVGDGWLPSLPCAALLSSMPVSGWCIGVRFGWALGGSEKDSEKDGGSDDKRSQKKKTSERWVCCMGLQYSSNSHGNAMMM